MSLTKAGKHKVTVFFPDDLWEKLQEERKRQYGVDARYLLLVAFDEYLKRQESGVE